MTPFWTFGEAKRCFIQSSSVWRRPCCGRDRARGPESTTIIAAEMTVLRPRVTNANFPCSKISTAMPATRGPKSIASSEVPTPKFVIRLRLRTVVSSQRFLPILRTDAGGFFGSYPVQMQSATECFRGWVKHRFLI